MCAFGRNAGLSPEESLERLLHMDSSDVNADLILGYPDPWTAESILKEVHEFLEYSESLNDMLEEAV